MKPKTMVVCYIVTVCIAMAVLGLGAIIMTNRVEKQFKLHDATKEAHDVTKEQLAICKRNLATFKNLTEKNVADIESYILTNYKRVPGIVAKEISIQTVALASEYGVAAPILVGMMEVESNFGPHAVSKKQARGLMQVRWKVWGDTLKDQGFTDHHQLHQINTGIEAGIIVFKYYMEQNDDNISKALYAYVGKNTEYVTKVYSAMGKFVLHGVSTIPTVEDYDANRGPL
jgi:hypothetical protein